MRLTLVIIFLFIATIANADWNLTSQDEFNGASLNTSNWMTTFPDGSRANDNAELEYYVDNAFTFPSPGSGGYIQINTTKQNTNYAICDNGTCQYTSGMLSSYGHFNQAYGLYEIRMWLSAGQGLWPAFWMIPNNLSWPPEIDALELLGQAPSTGYYTYHDPSNNISQGTTTSTNFTTGWHDVRVDWEPGSITWYLDGTQVYQATSNITSLPMYVIFNYAIGGNWGGYPDTPTSNALANNTVPVKIDYIRVYQKVANGTGDYSSIPGPTPIPTLHGAAAVALSGQSGAGKGGDMVPTSQAIVSAMGQSSTGTSNMATVYGLQTSATAKIANIIMQ